jgi:SAM-dependent methyltransferase
MKAFLPGTTEQVKFLVEKINVKDMSVCVFGSNSEYASLVLSKQEPARLNLIVEDHDSFINSKLVLKSDPNIDLRVMAFDNTDFPGASFDLVYAQASISGKKRTQIVKEIKKILKPGGYLCVGEIVSLEKEPPAFIKDIWFQSGITPLPADELSRYYEERNFKTLSEVVLDYTLEDFYSMSQKKLDDAKNSLSGQEKTIYKKLLSRVSHESNTYLKHGGNKYIGFKSLLLQLI